MTSDHIEGNSHADRLTTIAASQVEPDMNAVHELLGNTKLVSLIQHRLAAILCRLPHRTHERRPHPTGNTRISTRQLMESTMHALVQAGNVVRCGICNASQSICNSKEFRNFLLGDCKPVKVNKDTRVGSPILFNGRPTHPSHHLRCMRGLFYCVKCGAIAGKRLKLLAIECKERKSYYGKANLDRLAAGLLPKKVAEWPDDIPSKKVKSILTEQEKEAVQGVQEALDAILHECKQQGHDGIEDDNLDSDCESSSSQMECYYPYDSDTDSLHPLLRTYSEPDVPRTVSPQASSVSSDTE